MKIEQFAAIVGYMVSERMQKKYAFHYFTPRKEGEERIFALGPVYVASCKSETEKSDAVGIFATMLNMRSKELEEVPFIIDSFYSDFLDSYPQLEIEDVAGFERMADFFADRISESFEEQFEEVDHPTKPGDRYLFDPDKTVEEQNEWYYKRIGEYDAYLKSKDKIDKGSKGLYDSSMKKMEDTNVLHVQGKLLNIDGGEPLPLVEVMERK